MSTESVARAGSEVSAEAPPPRRTAAEIHADLDEIRGSRQALYEGDDDPTAAYATALADSYAREVVLWHEAVECAHESLWIYACAAAIASAALRAGEWRQRASQWPAAIASDPAPTRPGPERP